VTLAEHPRERRWNEFLRAAGFGPPAQWAEGIVLRSESVRLRFLEDPASLRLPAVLRRLEVEERRALLFHRAPVPPPGRGVFEEWFELVCTDPAGDPRDFPVALLVRLLGLRG
jgi:hypothetical protein